VSFLGLGAADPSSPEAVGQRAAAPAISDYVRCLSKGGLERAFYLQDPRQEVVTRAHRLHDPCYPAVSRAILAYVPPLARELARLKGLDVSFTIDQAVLMQRRLVAGAPFDAQGLRFTPDDLKALFESATENAEYDAQLAATTQIGRVRAVDARRTQAEIKSQQEGVRRGEVKRGPITTAEIVTPEEQRRRAAQVDAESAAARAVRGPIGPAYVRGSSRGSSRGSDTNWWLVAGGLGLMGLILLGVSWGRSRGRSRSRSRGRSRSRSR